MCTATLYRSQGSFLLTASRDESRCRKEAGIKESEFEDSQIVYPVDAAANGTWVGCNSHGLAACLLNLYQSDYQGVLSRGLIIPKLLENTSLKEAHTWLTDHFQTDLYSAFVLLLMDTQHLYRYQWDGEIFVNQRIDFNHWFLESSSSVDLENTLAYRHDKFFHWKEDNGKASDVLSFHLKRDADASKSVCMAREKSHTKSISQVSVTQNDVEFRYLAPEKLESAINTVLKPSALQCFSLNAESSGLPKACSA